jgi:hypothetical protein
MPGKRSSFTLPVEPISPPPKPEPRLAGRTAGFGGGAGYRPRVRRAYFDAVYRHSRTRRRFEYNMTPLFLKGTGPGETKTAHTLEKAPCGDLGAGDDPADLPVMRPLGWLLQAQ